MPGSTRQQLPAGNTARYRQLVELTTDWVWQVDASGTYTHVSPNVLEIMGYAAEEVLGRTPFDFMAPAEAERVGAVFRDAAARKAPLRGVEDTLRTRDGREVVFETHAVPLLDEDGELLGYFGTCRDVTETRRAETALRESRALLAESERVAHVGGWDWDVPAARVTFTEEWMRIHGVRQRSLPTDELMRIAHPDDRAAIAAAWDATRRRGEPYDIRHRIVRQDTGEVRWIHARGEVQRDESGRPVRVLGVAQDITETKQVEDALRQNEEVMRYIIKHDPNALAVYDKDLRYIAVSDRYLQDYGVAEEDVLGKHHYEVFPEMPQRWKDVHRRVLAGATERNDDDWFRRTDGSITYNRWECRPWYEADGSIGGMITYTEVTTERKRAEHALRQSKRILDATGKMARIGGWEHDLKANTAVWTEALHDIIEIPRDQDPPGPDEHLDYYPSPDRETLRQAYERAVADGVPFALELRVHTARGRLLWCRVRGEPVFRDGTCVAMRGVFQDITELKEKEAMLLQAQKMEAVGQLAGGVAHDFRNQLQVIQGFASILLRGNDLDEGKREKLRQVLTAAERSSRLTDQLLAFSRQETLHPRVIEVRQAVRELQTSLPRMIGEDIRLRVATGHGPTWARIDPVQFHQAMLNLCLNARDAMPAGGELRIDVRRAHLDRDESRKTGGLDPGEYVVVAVCDSGVGMDEDTRARVFDPFFTTKEVGKGTGLGLSMVHGFVSQSGGTVTCDSRSGEGSTFRMYVPAASAAATSGQTDRVAPPAPRGSGRILLVEDEQAVRKLLAVQLAEAGYEVFQVDTPRAALDALEARNAPVDLLVTDVVMPGQSGFELTEKALGLRPDMKVLYISGYAEEELARRRLTGHRTEILQKPFSRAQLLHAVAACLAR